MIRWIKILFGLELNQLESVLRASNNLTVYIVKRGDLVLVHQEIEDLTGLSVRWKRCRIRSRKLMLSFKYDLSKYSIGVLSFSDMEAVKRKYPTLIKDSHCKKENSIRTCAVRSPYKDRYGRIRGHFPSLDTHLDAGMIGGLRSVSHSRTNRVEIDIPHATEYGFFIK